MKFTVKRSEWGRGCEYDSFLLNGENNKKCCLGFLAMASGATEEEICFRGKPMPNDGVKWPAALFSNSNPGSEKQSDICFSLMKCNDMAGFSETEREKILTKIFASINIEVEFVD